MLEITTLSIYDNNKILHHKKEEDWSIAKINLNCVYDMKNSSGTSFFYER